MERNHIVLNLARQEFRIVCSEEPAYMKKLESSVNARISSTLKKYPSMSTMRAVLLAMLEMEDDLYKARMEHSVDAKGKKADEQDDF